MDQIELLHLFLKGIYTEIYVELRQLVQKEQVEQFY